MFSPEMSTGVLVYILSYTLATSHCTELCSCMHLLQEFVHQLSIVTVLQRVRLFKFGIVAVYFPLLLHL